VKFRSRYWLAAVLGACLGQAPSAVAADPLPGEPARLGPVPGKALPTAAPSANQQLADTIARDLRQSGALRHYQIDVTVQGASAEVRGTVADQTQREEALRIVQGVPGVERVVDRLALTGAIQPVQAVRQPEKLPEPSPTRPGGLPPGGPVAEPAPIFQAPPPSPATLNPPAMPPYAWPTYAPYNNYSRVAYPEAYPYNAWPFIGPVYPFPKIPPGWRSVKLEWQDGYWWFSKVATKHDWWRLRYW
jgi:hypothetical protein